MINMNYELCMARYGVDDEYLSILMSCILEKKGLYETNKIINATEGMPKLPLEQIYSLVTSICNSIFCEEIGDISPLMQSERQNLGTVTEIKSQLNKDTLFDELISELECLYLELDDVG